MHEIYEGDLQSLKIIRKNSISEIEKKLKIEGDLKKSPMKQVFLRTTSKVKELFFCNPNSFL
jgi:hypothetical protein